MNKAKIELVNTGSYKVGINEIKGLKAECLRIMAPVFELLQSKIYWSEQNIGEVEYLHRDGFIPHSHNCGGVEFVAVLPKCEEYSFCFVEFGEHDDDCELFTKDSDCSCGEQDGLLDSLLCVRLKFEGVQDDGSLQFYLFMEGGNNDAPYFRDVPTIFEAEFTCKSVSGLSRAASKHIKQLLKTIGA